MTTELGRTPRLVDLKTLVDERGALTAIEPGDGTLPFDIKRVYYIHNLIEGITRGHHAHRELEQLMIAVAGQLEVTLDNGFDRATFVLDNPAHALWIPKSYWRELSARAPGTVALILASRPYEEADYIRDYDTFVAEARRKDLTLVPFDREVLDLSWHWLQDPELRALTLAPTIERDAQLAWFESLASRVDYKLWGVAHDGEVVGVCGLKAITTNDAEYFGYFGVRRLWGRGLGATMVRLMMDEARARDLTSLYLRVGHSNERARRLYHKLGFELTSVSDDLCWMKTSL